MLRVELPVELTLQAPFLTQSTAPGTYGIDAVQARNHQGRTMLPGTLIMGRLRQSWEELRSALDASNPSIPSVPTAEEISDLCGEESAQGGYEPSRKRLHCTDFLLQGVEPGTAVRNRIAMDRERGAAKPRHLLALETPYASGATRVFAGQIRFDADDSDQAERIHEQIVCGLQWIAQLGAFRGIGFGRLVDVVVHSPQPHEFEAQDSQEQQGGPSASGLDLICIPEAPFCVADRRRAGNIFTSLEEIPGNVLKGCVAETLRRLKRDAAHEDWPYAGLEKHFSRIRFSHAFPSATCLTRPVHPPLSLVKSDGLYDVALLDGPALIKGRAPAFSVDWKETGDVRSLFGWPELRKEMRVRTAMDREKLRHKDEELFAYEMTVPDGQCWLARIDVSDIEEEADRRQVLEELTRILRPGLLGLGKSKVAVRIETMAQGAFRSAQPQDTAVSLDGLEGFLVLTLQTPALLLNPEDLRASNDHSALLEAYRTGWAELSGNLLTLKRFFAQQTLAGGRYHQGRFQQGLAYRPWLLTTAGSVFVFSFRADETKAVQEKVRQWLCKGLDLPSTVITAYGLQKTQDEDLVAVLWKRCPYIPQNGFGEIAVNLAIHRDWHPRNEADPIPTANEPEV